MSATKLPKFSPTSQEELQLASRVTESRNLSSDLLSLLTDLAPRRISSTVVAEAGTSPNTDKQRNASFEARFFFASKGWCLPECMEVERPFAPCVEEFW